MLTVFKAPSRAITSAERIDNSLLLHSEAGTLRISPVTDSIIRITWTVESEFRQTQRPGVILRDTVGNWKYTEDAHTVRLSTKGAVITADRATGALSYCDASGRILLRDRARYSREMERFDMYALDGSSSKTEQIQTADGLKTVIRDASKVVIGQSWHTRLNLTFGDEALYGLGQQEEGFMNLRGQTVYLHQGNRKISVPFLVSTLGYGILYDSYSAMIFNDTQAGSYFYSEADPEMEYYFLCGVSGTDTPAVSDTADRFSATAASGTADRFGTPAASDTADRFGTTADITAVASRDAGDTPMNRVIALYRQLTGKAVMLPKWAFGFIQSQERYETQDEIINVATETRAAGIGLDCMVLDWISWDPAQWGQKSFDRSRFPDPVRMMNDLHDMHTHFMLSIWPSTGDCEDRKELIEEGLMIPESDFYNPMTEHGREVYWRQLNREHFKSGVDSWWCDNSEPFTPEWNHGERIEPAKLFNEYCKEAGLRINPELMNCYSLYHSQGIYEGQRKTTDRKRVCNLTRSGYTGQQRYGTIMWSGDISASWDTLASQIPAGLNFCASGLPYWTVDTGAFFVRDGAQWFWRGDFPQANEDLGYRELYVRWLQWSAFLPVFRIHGTDCRREFKNFGKPGDMFYDALIKANHTRYELLPYIYSAAGFVWLNDRSLIRPLAFDFTEDKEVYAIRDQYMFGDSIMVCPVTKPMFYGPGSVPLEGVEHTRKVYLPTGCDWFDMRTGERFGGGTTVTAAAELDSIPVFVREGSIIPMTSFALSTEEQTGPVRYSIYGAENSISSLFYTDGADSYDYESGSYSVKKLVWDCNSGIFSVDGQVIDEELVSCFI